MTHVLCFTGFENKSQLGTNLVLTYTCHIPDTWAREFLGQGVLLISLLRTLIKVSLITWGGMI